MPKRIGLFVDVSNLYHCINTKYNKKLDYAKYIDFCKALGEIKIAKAYGAQVKNQASGFLRCLRQFGYTPVYQTPKTFKNPGGLQHKANYDMHIAIGVVQAIEDIDILVLGSADGDFTPLVEWANKRGVKTIVFACAISSDLKKEAHETMEIPESFMEDKNAINKTKSTGT
jgi:uncharacterized LabA/DUF88 family protein